MLFDKSIFNFDFGRKHIETIDDHFLESPHQLDKFFIKDHTCFVWNILTFGVFDIGNSNEDMILK